MENGAFAYPKVYYFEQGNPYTGSYKELNYKIVPQKDTGELLVTVWYGLFCSAVAEPVEQQRFPMTAQGLEQSRQYLWETYCAYRRGQVACTN